MPMEEYLTGVIAVKYRLHMVEALKAQTVAARTLVVHQMPEYGGRAATSIRMLMFALLAHCREWISRSDAEELGRGF